MKIANATLPQFSRQALRARNHRLSKCSTDASGAKGYKMIFISHNYHDKVVIEPIAERLSDIFGKSNVFYDSWSIQPGDGIIDKMNEGLENATHLFFFVSENSIKSKMVKMEWQNAIFKSSKGKCKVIPIRLDETSMPPVLAQNLYIDLYSYGIETTIAQMVNVIQGNSTYNSSANKFSNSRIQ